MTALDPRVRAVARRIVRECAAVRAGEHVHIDGRLDAAAYLEELAHECELAGATALVVARSDERTHRRLTELTEAQLSLTCAPELEAVRAADVVVVVRMEDGDPRLFADVTPAQRAAQQRGRKPIGDVIFGGGKRWIGTDYPTPAQAAAFNLEWGAFNDMFWRALDVDYGELQEKADAAASLFEGAREVRIRSPRGTDVTLGVAGRPVDKDVGLVGRETDLSNLPAGEICLAPLEDQADGTVVFDLAFWDGRRIEDLEVSFESGVATPVGAAREFEYFCGVLDAADDAARVIGELGIGLNPAVGHPCGYTLTDEKILGTVHLALGDNRMLGGVNDSVLHWDMMIMRPTVEVDGRPLLDDGEWLL